ncbi:MAG: eukaryotic-like serine/threonine-protein kinase [Myxococcales bacterium]|nr:eukaryotic-like serine/threonine-protein kinase [Myxococcales bacterium]
MESGKVVAGKYRLNQLLGSGGMAEVWSATNTFTERQLAIKFMNTQVGKSPEAAARFLKEAKVSARINHANIIEIHDVGQTDQGQLFLVMELLTGFPLEVALRRQNPPMTVYEFMIVMVEVGDALAAAHKSGIVHRDLKPTNIFLHKPQTGTPMPKLLDFGVSKFLEDDQNHALTIAGTVLGSPLYMSPEQARGESNLDGRTDVFAFGAILFEALCGYRAYEAKNFNALIVKIATSKPKSIDECAPHVPASLRAIVRGCLEVDLKKRLQSFEEITSRVRSALPELEASGQRLPTPLIATSVVDPDATNALPVLRASDRPPPAAHYTPGHSFTPPSMPAAPATGGSGSMPPGPPLSMSGSIPPGSIPPYPASGPTGPSWHTPNTSYASITVSAPRPRSTAWIAAGAVALGVVALGAGVGLGWKGRGAGNASSSGSGSGTGALAKTAETSKAGSPPPPATTPLPTATTNEPPSISVDSLPGTSGGTVTNKALGPVPRGSGRLLVTATPGWCNLTVDGKERGPTPIAGIDLPSGAHQLRCDAPGGKIKTTSVTIQDGATSRIKLALDE